MAQLLRFTPSYIRQLRERADKSFFFFSRALWGNKDIDPDVHGDLCRFLQYEEWLRLLVCASRGLLKSSIVHSWGVWMGLTTVNWSAMLIEQREQNARNHHEKIQARFRWGKYAGLLQAVYEDRLSDGFDGWTTGPAGRTIFTRTDPDADPFLTHAGMDSKLESAHKDCLIIDDPEGADADKSDAPNAEAKKLIEERAEPLLKEPGKGQIVAAMTPHGADPTAWYLRDLAGEQERQNPENRLRWRVYWKPLTDNGEENGRSVWPERYSQAWLEDLRFRAERSTRARRMLDMQYLLKRATISGAALDYQKIIDTAYERRGAVIRYKKVRYAQPSVENQFQYLQSEEEVAHINLGYTNRYLHIDPLHKDPLERKAQGDRPARWAITATAVAHDFHVFVVEAWLEDASFDVAIDNLFRMYRYWQPKAVTYEPTGAQSWLKNHVRILEKSRYNRGIVSLPNPWNRMQARLPAITSRLVEAEKANTMSKEPWIIENLELPVNLGYLHFAAQGQEELLKEVERFGIDSRFYVDGLDSLAQGPKVWEPPISPERKKAMKWKAFVEDMMRPADPLTGYRRPWNDAA